MPSTFDNDKLEQFLDYADKFRYSDHLNLDDLYYSYRIEQLNRLSPYPKAEEPQP